MRVVLSGASGVFGRELIAQLHAAGHAVTGITRRAGSLSDTPASEIVGDLTKRSALLESLAGSTFDAVIHQATALKKAPRSFGDMRQTNRLRWEGTSTLIAAARATRAKRFIVASNFTGYGFQDHGAHPRDESQPFGVLPGSSVDAVQSALLSGEQQARAYGGIALRYGLFYRSRGPIPTVPGDWDGELAWIHLVDAAAATVAALERGKRGAVYNIADDLPVSWRELHTARAHALDLPEPREVPSWLIRAVAPFGSELLTRTSMRVPNTLAKKELAWEPRYPSHREGLAGVSTVAEHAREVMAGRANILRP